LSKISSTVAWPTGLRPEDPEKITSVMASPRNRLAALSPITQRIASMMLDLPQPLGPQMPVRLVGRWRTVGSTNDLNPASLMVDRRMGQRLDITATEGPASNGPGECASVPNPGRQRNDAKRLVLDSDTYMQNLTTGALQCLTGAMICSR
jgi:hypothetical protein